MQTIGIPTKENMICPKCKYDYKDVEEGELPGGVVRVDDHFYKTFRRLGRRCTNCGFIAEFIEKPTGDPFYKRPLLPIEFDPKTVAKRKRKTRR
jgi:ribosomal protein S27AE